MGRFVFPCWLLDHSLQVNNGFAGSMCSRRKGSQIVQKTNAKVPDVLVV